MVPAADRDAAVAAAVREGVAWLETVEIASILRRAPPLSACTRWKSRPGTALWLLEKNPSVREGFEASLRERLARSLITQKLCAALDGEGGTGAFTEVAVLADRCRQHGLDPGAAVPESCGASGCPA